MAMAKKKHSTDSNKIAKVMAAFNDLSLQEKWRLFKTPGNPLTRQFANFTQLAARVIIEKGNVDACKAILGQFKVGEGFKFSNIDTFHKLVTKILEKNVELQDIVLGLAKSAEDQSFRWDKDFAVSVRIFELKRTKSWEAIRKQLKEEGTILAKDNIRQKHKRLKEKLNTILNWLEDVNEANGSTFRAALECLEPMDK
jgi:hypothetical protein